MHYLWESPSDGVFRCRLPFLDVTVGLVRGSAANLLIDCGTTLVEASNLAADVAELIGGAVTHLVMTHHHFDHVLGSAGFGGAQLYGSPAVELALTSKLDEVRAHALEYDADPTELNDAIGGVRALDHVTTNAELDLGDRVVRVEHPGRGHTDHDLIVIVPAVDPTQPTVVFCGDLVEESADPAIDSGSDLDQWPLTLDRMLALGGPQARYVPGHGAVVDGAFVSAQRDWLAAKGAAAGS